MSKPDEPGQDEPRTADELAGAPRRRWWSWRRKRRKMSKRLVVTLFTINAGVIGGIIYLFTLDPGTTPEIRAYFKPPPAVALELNGWSAMAGLDAPADADMLDFGVRKLRSYLDKETEKPEYTPLQIKSIDLSRMECWYMPYLEQAKQNCLSMAELQDVLERNALMLARYKQLYHFPVFDVQPQTEFRAAPINTLKELHKLQMSKISLTAAQGDKEEALRLWIEEMHFQRNLNLSQMTALDMVFRLEMLERTARLLPHLIHGEQKLATEYYDDLLDVLDPPGRGLWPFEDTIRNEGLLWVRRVRDGARRFTTDDGRVLYRPVKLNIFKRKYYAYAQALSRAYEYPTGEGVQMAIAAVQKDYNSTLFRGMEDLSSPAQSIISNFMMSGVVSTAHLLSRVLQREDLLRMLCVFVMAEAEGVAPHEMQAFLKSQPGGFYSNMSGEHYLWDAEAGLIYSLYFDRLLNEDIKNIVRIGTSPQK